MLQPPDWDQIEPGQTLEPWVDAPVSRTDIVKYQGASGDFDAAHHDDEHARRFGFEGVFSLGLLHAGIMSGFAVRYFGVNNIRRFRVRFKGIVQLGDVLTYRGTIVRKREEGGLRFVDVDLVCERAGSKPVIVGEATFVVDQS